MTMVVVCDDPPDLTRWLSTPALKVVDLLTTVDIDVRPIDEPADNETSAPDPAKRCVLRFPLDGPDTVLPLAAAGLHSRLRQAQWPVTVIAGGAHGIPPTIGQLTALAGAGLSIGVDLTACPWVTKQDAFLITRFGAARVPVQWRSTNASGDLARALLATGQPHEGTHLHTWLLAATQSFTPIDDHAWEMALQALYIDSIVVGR